jgi:hypothetical protein
VVTHKPIEFSQLMFGHCPNRATDVIYGGVRKAIVHEDPVLPGLDQSRLPQGLQVLRGVGQGQPDFLRERIDGALTLGQQFQNLQAVGAGEGLANASELTVEAVLEHTVRIGCHDSNQ